MQGAALLRLLRLASPSLPVGAYSYSQGLESAVEAGIVGDEPTALAWVGDVLAHSMSRLEAPVFLRLMRAWRAADPTAIRAWSGLFLASRDSAEFRAETLQMGYSLAVILREQFGGDPRIAWLPARVGEDSTPWPSAMAAACALLDTPETPSLEAYLFAWVENQVLAALKAVPLGQAAGQRMLVALEAPLLAAARTAAQLGDDELSNWTPGLSMLSMRHETQYSRVFRS